MIRKLLFGERKRKARNIKLEAAKENKGIAKDSILVLDENEERNYEICQTVRRALDIMETHLSVQSITDSFDIMDMGITEQPAIMIEGKVICRGKKVSTAELIQLLHNYMSE